jgi:hypothetical protein
MKQTCSFLAESRSEDVKKNGSSLGIADWYTIAIIYF